MLGACRARFESCDVLNLRDQHRLGMVNSRLRLLATACCLLQEVGCYDRIHEMVLLGETLLADTKLAAGEDGRLFRHGLGADGIDMERHGVYGEFPVIAARLEPPASRPTLT